MTLTPDLVRAMLTVASRAGSLAPSGDAFLHAPTPPALSQRLFAQQKAAKLGLVNPQVRAIPKWAPLPLVPFSPTTRWLLRQIHLWDNPMVLHPGGNSSARERSAST